MGHSLGDDGISECIHSFIHLDRVLREGLPKMIYEQRSKGFERVSHMKT